MHSEILFAIVEILLYLFRPKDLLSFRPRNLSFLSFYGKVLNSSPLN